jgi:hypothetical protein
MGFGQLLCLELVVHQWKKRPGIETHDVIGIPAIHPEHSDFSKAADTF